MGRSAKLHKRAPKATASSATQPKPVAPSAPVVRQAKKCAGLKCKAKAKSGPEGVQDEHVLCGADYVTLMLGGRRRAAEEALKLPAER